MLMKKITKILVGTNNSGKLKEIKYEDVPNFCDKFRIKKNLINVLYLS